VPRQGSAPGIGSVRPHLTDQHDEVFTVGAADDAEVVRRGYEAFNTGDLTTLGALFAEDAVWHVPGRGALSGTKNGRYAILAFFREVGERSQGTFRANVRDIVAGENHTVGIHQGQATRDGKTLDLATAVVFVLRDGQVAEVQEFYEDTVAADGFWD
jgi:uncharacterized protein